MLARLKRNLADVLSVPSAAHKQRGDKQEQALPISPSTPFSESVKICYIDWSALERHSRWQSPLALRKTSEAELKNKIARHVAFETRKHYGEDVHVVRRSESSRALFGWCVCPRNQVVKLQSKKLETGSLPFVSTSTNHIRCSPHQKFGNWVRGTLLRKCWTTGWMVISRLAGRALESMCARERETETQPNNTLWQHADKIAAPIPQLRTWVHWNCVLQVANNSQDRRDIFAGRGPLPQYKLTSHLACHGFHPRELQVSCCSWWLGSLPMCACSSTGQPPNLRHWRARLARLGRQTCIRDHDLCYRQPC